jgi:hypothetical protein
MRKVLNFASFDAKKFSPSFEAKITKWKRSKKFKAKKSEKKQKNQKKQKKSKKVKKET